ncbi:MAG TPA: WSC domain-containing protein, partial [Anaeromyxobacteraceae bacterium]|nr:WSC domain-containing protein [Anaeromyxobacteraceae bacterium]
MTKLHCFFRRARTLAAPLALAAATAGTQSPASAQAQGTSASYQGCYTDESTRALNSELISSGATVETCIAAAQAKGFSYAGLQYGGQCYAGNTLRYTKVADSQCTSPCTANSSEICGGSWLNSIYSTTITPPTPTPTSAPYDGCYTDSATRALGSELISSGATVETCVAAAQAKGFSYAGLQYGGQCYAGNTLGYTKVADSQCTSPCTANSSEICGGSWLNSIYSTTITPPTPTPTPTPTPPTGSVVTVSTTGHAGTAADPYPGANIQAAINSVASGGTVRIPAGNWSLAGVSGGQITVSKANITIQGAGSGNVFDQYGHPVYSASPSGTYTRLFTNNDTNRFVLQDATGNVTVRDIFFDGATQGTGGGAYNAFLLVINAKSGIQFRNLRVTQSSQTMEACASTFNTPGTTWYDTAFFAPSGHCGLLQTNGAGPTILKNCFFHNNSWNPICESDDVMDGCVETMGPGSGCLASV